jgi:integrase
VIKAVKSLLARKGIALTQRIKVQRKDSEHEQHIPTQAELRKVLGAANLRARAAISLMAFSGCRIEVMGDGRDGLRIGDIPDLKLVSREGGQDIEWANVPARITVRAALSKTGKPYFTFLGPEGVGNIEAYLRARILRGETLTARSVVVGTAKIGNHQKEVKYGGTNIGDAIRSPMRQAGINERPYIWRSYFAATADRCRDLPSDWREFFMGHVSGVVKTYTLNKGLPPEKVGEMRAAYAKALPLLETGQPEALNRVAEVERRLAELVAAKL